MSSTYSALFFISLLVLQDYGCLADCKEGNSNQDTCNAKAETDWLWDGVRTVGIASAVIAGTPILASVAGFGVAGITAGTAAAAIQSAWFGGAVTGMTGAAFAGMQSIGSAGLTLGAKTTIVAGTGALVKAYDYVMGNKEDKEEDNNKEEFYL